jgi:hypothetical protein
MIMEIPYNKMACFHFLKLKKGIDFISGVDPKNQILGDVDELGEAVYQRGVRAQMSEKASEAYADAKSQEIAIKEGKADTYLVSVLSSVYRLPPFDYSPIDGYSFLNIRFA